MTAPNDDTQPVELPPAPASTQAPLPPGPAYPDRPPAPQSSATPPPAAPQPLTPAPNSPIRVTELKQGPDMAVRAIWFIFIGWWATGIVSAFAWVLCVTIIGLPLGIWMINRIPTVLTLRPRTAYRYEYTDELGRRIDVVDTIEQPPWYIRGLWFVFVGWWLSGLAMTIAWVLCVLLITLPVGLIIYNRVPFVASLYRY
jgi:uncharacterized membrane protein YccF (DUF307 family)